MDKLLNFRKLIPYALKGQKLLAQGTAWVITDAKLTPCKGKSFKDPDNL